MYFIEDRCPHLFPDEDEFGAFASAHGGASAPDIPPFFAGRASNGRMTLAIQAPRLADLGGVLAGARRVFKRKPAEPESLDAAEIIEGDSLSSS